MENLPLLVPYVILVPAIGAIINYFAGARLGEKPAGYIGISAAVLSFIFSLFLLVFVTGTGGEAAIVSPPLLDGWLQIEAVDFSLDLSWQLRVDSLSVTMMLVVTGVGSLIHIYALGYMHGDNKFPRFFAYLNMFLFFMLILVTGNNFLVMFVGWEGVGLCSYLLIGFWWDKKNPEGWKNSNAAKKAFVVNRVGDFGLLIAMFLIFWTFGTLDFYKPTELANPIAGQELHAEDAAHDESEDATSEDEHADDTAATDEDEHADDAAAAGDDEHADSSVPKFTDNTHLEEQGYSSLGIFNQVEALLELEDGETLVYGFDADGNPIERGRTVDIGGWELDIQDVVVLIVLFMLLGVTGKSAQIPLFIWLPDAMAGPTPVSALIHAATMVTAGVYLMVRANVLVSASPVEVRLLITVVGSVTALMAGFIAVAQWDIKRVLAYSTISQLGFMVAAVGVGAYAAAMFHLVTHAFFKALLFLGSGSVIHGMEHGHHHAHEHGHEDDPDFDPQDMRFMGGLRRKMPLTFITYLIGTLALAGIPPLAGFWSKDEILVDALQVGIQDNLLSGFIAFGLLLTAAGFTAFYMWRQIRLVFFGQTRSSAANFAPESTRSMVIPLMVLAVLSIFGGFLNTPAGAPIVDGIYSQFEFKHFLEHSVIGITRGHAITFDLGLALLATGVGVVAIFVAHRIYGGDNPLSSDNRDPLESSISTRSIWKLSNARLYWDEIYNLLLVRPFEWLADFFANTFDWAFLHDYLHDSVIARGFNGIGNLLSQPFDLGIVDGTVNGIGRLVQGLSGSMRRIQSGYVRSYAVILLLGVVLVILIMLLPLLQNGS